MKPFTWKDLKEFCNNLPENQLGSSVRVWGDDRGFTIDGKSLLEDDYFNPSGEGMEPVSVYKQNPEDWEVVKDDPIIMEKGSPVLLIDLK